MQRIAGFWELLSVRLQQPLLGWVAHQDCSKVNTLAGI